MKSAILPTDPLNQRIRNDAPAIAVLDQPCGAWALPPCIFLHQGALTMEPCDQCRELQEKCDNALNAYRMAFAARDEAARMELPRGFREGHERVLATQMLLKEARRRLELHRASHS